MRIIADAHACRTNFTVTYNGGGEGRSEDSYDVLADDAEGALAEVTYGTCELNDGDTVTITKHELRTAQDCDCERRTQCGQAYATTATRTTEVEDMRIIAEAHAWICTDCLMLHANGDLSGYEGDADAFEQRVHNNLAPKARITGLIGENAHGQYSVSPGWGRKQHPCATNYTVTYPNGDVHEVYSEEEYLDDVLGDTDNMLKLAEGDTFTITKHELQTVQDAGGDCDCETDNFACMYCDSCGTYIVGTFYGATIWEVTE